MGGTPLVDDFETGKQMGAAIKGVGFGEGERKKKKGSDQKGIQGDGTVNHKRPLPHQDFKAAALGGEMGEIKV